MLVAQPFSPSTSIATCCINSLPVSNPILSSTESCIPPSTTHVTYESSNNIKLTSSIDKLNVIVDKVLEYIAVYDAIGSVNAKLTESFTSPSTKHDIEEVNNNQIK